MFLEICMQIHSVVFALSHLWKIWISRADRYGQWHKLINHNILTNWLTKFFEIFQPLGEILQPLASPSLSKRLFNFWDNTYFMSQFFVATSILDVSQFVKMLWFMIYELVLRNFNCSLEFVFSLLLLQPFNFSPVSIACNFQDWGCVILHEIDFLLKICWSIPCLHPSWKVHISTPCAFRKVDV